MLPLDTSLLFNILQTGTIYNVFQFCESLLILLGEVGEYFDQERSDNDPEFTIPIINRFDCFISFVGDDLQFGN